MHASAGRSVRSMGCGVKGTTCATSRTEQNEEWSIERDLGARFVPLRDAPFRVDRNKPRWDFTGEGRVAPRLRVAFSYVYKRKRPLSRRSLQRSRPRHRRSPRYAGCPWKRRKASRCNDILGASCSRGLSAGCHGRKARSCGVAIKALPKACCASLSPMRIGSLPCPFGGGPQQSDGPLPGGSTSAVYLIVHGW